MKKLVVLAVAAMFSFAVCAQTATPVAPTTEKKEAKVQEPKKDDGKMKKDAAAPKKDAPKKDATKKGDGKMKKAAAPKKDAPKTEEKK